MLQLNQVCRNFATDIAISNVSATFFPSSVTALLGANGAGKSTLLKLMAGWLPVRRNLMLIEGRGAASATAGPSIIETIKDYQCDYPAITDDAAAWFERLNLVGCYSKNLGSLSKGQTYKLAMIGLFLVRPRFTPNLAARLSSARSGRRRRPDSLIGLRFWMRGNWCTTNRAIKPLVRNSSERLPIALP